MRRTDYKYLAGEIHKIPGIDDRAAAVFRSWVAGKTHRELGKEFGVTHTRIGKILEVSIRRIKTEAMPAVEVCLEDRISDAPLSNRFKRAVCTAFGPDVTLGKVAEKTDRELLALPKVGREAVIIFRILLQRTHPS